MTKTILRGEVLTRFSLSGFRQTGEYNIAGDGRHPGSAKMVREWVTGDALFISMCLYQGTSLDVPKKISRGENAA
jgi:hypothetical protein